MVYSDEKRGEDLTEAVVADAPRTPERRAVQ
jgi:hypothetical protein